MVNDLYQRTSTRFNDSDCERSIRSNSTGAVSSYLSFSPHPSFNTGATGEKQEGIRKSGQLLKTHPP